MIFKPTENIEFSRKIIEFINALDKIPKTINEQNYFDFEAIKYEMNKKKECDKIAKKLIEISDTHSIYWSACSLLTFKKTYKVRLNNFINNNIGSTEDNFISCEILDARSEYENFIKKNYSGFSLIFENRISYLKSLKLDNAKTKLRSSTIDGTTEQYNPNLCNENCYNFLLYLIDNYYTGTIRQLTDIWHFLKKDFTEEGYQFYATHIEYASFIKEKLKVELKNWQQSNYKYQDTEKPKLKNHFTQFKSTRNE